MHEMAITQGIIDICLRHSGNKKIISVIVEIGVLSGVVPEAVEFCFAACSNDTAAENSRLEIIKTCGLGRCIDCNTEQAVERLYDKCQICGSYAMEILCGEEMRVVEIEVED